MINKKGFLSFLLICFAGAAYAEGAWVAVKKGCNLKDGTGEYVARWNGGCKDGYLHGKGVLEFYTNDSGMNWREEGSFNRGVRDGFFKVTSGAIVTEGTYVNNLMEGLVTTTYTSGYVITNYMVNGKIDGVYTTIHPDGTRVERYFSNGEEVGESKLYESASKKQAAAEKLAREAELKQKESNSNFLEAAALAFEVAGVAADNSGDAVRASGLKTQATLMKNLADPNVSAGDTIATFGQGAADITQTQQQQAAKLQAEKRAREQAQQRAALAQQNQSSQSRGYHGTAQDIEASQRPTKQTGGIDFNKPITPMPQTQSSEGADQQSQQQQAASAVANQCVSRVNEGVNTYLVNNCDQNIEASFCSEDSGTYYECRGTSSGGMGTILAHNRRLFSNDSKTTASRWNVFACFQPYAPRGVGTGSPGCW